MEFFGSKKRAHTEKRGRVVALDNINVVTNNNIEEYVKY